VTPDAFAERILVLAPTGRDGPLIARVLSQAGMTAKVCRDVNELCQMWDEGAGAGVVAEEALAPKNRVCLVEALAGQPMWSDFPLVILTGGGHTTKASTTIAQALETRGNVTLLERPLRILTLVSALHSALRARRRQYEVKRLLEETRLAVEQRDQFLAMLAHELRNPLSPIRNSLQVWKMPGARDSVVVQAREMAERQVSHMARLLDDLLDVARISRGKIELRKEPVDLARLVRATVEAIRPQIEARKHELSVSLAAEPLWVAADPTRLEQVLTNLLNNACKYTDPGGKIWVSTERQGAEAILRVRDNGIGIPADKLPTIFDLFVQAERRLDRSQGGIGIGLTLVRKLVELHGGTVDAFSAGSGQGSEFVVRLPALDGQGVLADGGSTREGHSAGPFPSHRVLVVDDNLDAADSLALMLELAGQEVRTAYNGPSALAVAQEFRPQVFVLDLGMPGMDGYALARQLRAQPEFREAILIALSGWGQEEDKRRSRDGGFDHHLIKPADPQTLTRLLEELAARRGA
jgi:signal transduction histidine kinase/CheY-like chemotaxis protein